MTHILVQFMSQITSLTNEETESIKESFPIKSFKKNHLLLKEGMIAINAYFVITGCIREYELIDGEEKTTAFYTEMEGLTPHCVINKAPSEYFISCVEDSILTIADPGMEVDIFKKFPKFETLCRVLSEELLA